MGDIRFAEEDFNFDFTCPIDHCGQPRAGSNRHDGNFDKDWFFHRGGMLGAENEPMNISKWRRLNLPHDWSIEDLPGTQSPFSPVAISQVGGGFTTGGTGWYRKSFFVPSSDKGKKLIVQFDGIYMNADVYINGYHLGNHPYGYTSFYFDISQQIKFGDSNHIAVEVKNEGQNSRWYSGSGIYRHVWLRKFEPVHILPWGTYITTPLIAADRAGIEIKSLVVNQGAESASVKVLSKILNPEGIEAARSEKEFVIAPGDEKEIAVQQEIKNPRLWSCESPALYEEITEVYQNEQLIYTERNHFGIRKISFDAENGFLLNGKSVKLKGGCFHIDNGPLGSVAYDRAEERKVELLKAAGFNAIRCSHNPPSPAFLDACDRLGMLVIDEAFDMWNQGKTPYDYHIYFRDWWKRDIQNMVMRDRNHPSIVMWSIGNEISEQGSAEGTETSRMLSDYIRVLDSTRPTTIIANELKPEMDSFFATVGIAGYNYAIGDAYNQSNVYARDHQRVPDRIMYGSETYPLKAFGSWMAVRDLSYVVGDFVWTAFDYIGEASIGWLGYPQKNDFYPWNLAYCGDLDICGWRRPQSYYRETLWKKNQLSVFVTSPYNTFKKDSGTASWAKWYWKDVWPEWNWNGFENKPLEVNVYSSCEQVELFLNGKSLGIKPTNQSNEYTAVWSVPFQPGILKAVGSSNGKPVQSAILKTASEIKEIKLTADRTLLHASGQDLSYINVELTDANGVINPSAENTVHFSVTGDGVIAGVGNANPMSLESFQLPDRKAWKGRCLVIIKAGKTTGKIRLTASSAGLKSSEIVLDVKNDKPVPPRAYYVSPTGNDKKAGTREAAFQSIGRLNSIALNPGDSIYFEGGMHFPGSLVLHQGNPGDQQHPVVISSYGIGRAFIDGGNESAVVIDGIRWLGINKLILTGSGRKKGNIREGLSIRNSDHITVDSLEITGFQKSGLGIDFSEDIIVRRVFSHDNGAAGISVGGEKDSKESNHHIYIGYCRAENNPG
ncbi:MAG TPA: glycoside hydrolase family 2 TIM barrel-domain containing protein, partial [Puia sp.]|nr:glycoside hydrolase family 2 TIM barrel-domain containing protein [Puia sp.]